MKQIIALLLAAPLLASCATPAENVAAGAVIGGVAGALFAPHPYRPAYYDDPYYYRPAYPSERRRYYRCGWNGQRWCRRW